MDRFTGSQLGPMLSMYPRWQACTLLCKPGKESWPQDTHVLVQQVTFVAWLCQSCGKGCTFFVHGFPVGMGSCSSTFKKRGASMDRFTGSQLGDKLVGLYLAGSSVAWVLHTVLGACGRVLGGFVAPPALLVGHSCRVSSILATFLQQHLRGPFHRHVSEIAELQLMAGQALQCARLAGVTHLTWKVALVLLSVSTCVIGACAGTRS